MGKFGIYGDSFIYENKPVRIVSGAIHYFRVVPEYWKDRLMKLKSCGLNTVETYVAWNIHEPKPGEFNFEGMADIVKFIETAGSCGLYVIIRPGPFICAEWEFGGLPSWLLTIPGLKLRCFNKPYLDRVDAFWDVLFKKLRPLLCTNGGPIIAMQVENEYGSYGNDSRYLNYLRDGMVRRGIDVLQFTSDGPADVMLTGGSLPDVYKTVNFGSKPEEAFLKLRECQNSGPLMCGEYWNGWFDHWGEKHHVRDPREAADVLDRILRMGASVNLYMFHGGTNFGFMNGANYQDAIQPTITSYDYDSPLDEAGDPTKKYYLIRAVLSKYVKVENTEISRSEKKSYGKVRLAERAGLFESLDTISSQVESASTMTMEELGQSFGFVLYRTHISGKRKGSRLTIDGAHDRALVFVGGTYAGTIIRGDHRGIVLDIPAEGALLDILVENLGRINYGSELGDMKGITKGVKLDYQFLFGWKMYGLPLDNIESLKFKPGISGAAPAFYRGKFNADRVADTFIKLKGWTKGVVFINRFNLGRYWSIGPQRTLYIPAPLLKAGENEIVVFELYRMDKPIIELLDNAELG